MTSLPPDLTQQVIESLLDQFEEGFDELDKAEHILQGVCFTFGELTRQGQLYDAALDRLLPCTLSVSPRPLLGTLRTKFWLAGFAL